jgi:hypothetical protein
LQCATFKEVVMKLNQVGATALAGVLMLSTSCIWMEENPVPGPQISEEISRYSAPMPPLSNGYVAPDPVVPGALRVESLPPVAQEYYPADAIVLGPADPAPRAAVIFDPMTGVPITETRFAVPAGQQQLPTTATQVAVPNVMVTPPVVAGDHPLPSTVVGQPTPTHEQPLAGTAPALSAAEAARAQAVLEPGVTPTITAGGLPITSTVTAIPPSATITPEPLHPDAARTPSVVVAPTLELGTTPRTATQFPSGVAPVVTTPAPSRVSLAERVGRLLTPGTGSARIRIENETSRTGELRVRINGQ